MSKWCVAYDGPYDDTVYRYFKSKEEAEKFAESVEDKEPNVYEVSSNLKIFNRLKITSKIRSKIK